MAFVRTADIGHYQWLSTDVPTVAGIKAGSIGLQTDTSRRFRFAGGAWVEETSATVQITFHNAAIVAAQGTVLTVGGLKTLVIEISGTSASRTIAFEGAGASGTYRAINGVRSADLAVATSTNTSGEIWQFDITGFVTVSMNLTAVAGGNVTITGRAVA